MTAEELIAFWGELDVNAASLAHPDDSNNISRHAGKVALYDGVESFVASDSFSPSASPQLHLSLLPAPYSGDLRKAEVFILTLNPGLTAANYVEEFGHRSIRKELVDSLKQEGLDPDFPFMWLNPAHAWTGGYDYWEGKFRSIAEELVNQQRAASYREALSILSRKIAVLELVAYHSRDAMAAWTKRLPSAGAIRDFVASKLAAGADANPVSVVCVRAAQFWNVGGAPGCIVYDNKEARSAHLSLNSRGGGAIAKRLGLAVP